MVYCKPSVIFTKLCKFKMTFNIDTIGKPVKLGEGPYWDEEKQTLYFVDIVNHSLHSYDTKTNQYNTVNVETEGKPVSLIIKVKGEDNKFVISVKNDLAIVCWDGKSSAPLIPEPLVTIESQTSTRLNDGKCDPSSRLWTGTMGPAIDGGWEKEKGSLYFLKEKEFVVKKIDKVSLSNGLAWSLDKKKFYYIDSLKYCVVSYDYEDISGDISNEKTVFCFKQNKIEGIPDGMTIDQEGMIWVACFEGGQVLRIDPNSGELKDIVKLPSPQTTSVIFGGPNFEDLYVTSAKVGFTKEREEKFPLAGSTFRITGLGVKGTPSIPIKL